MREWEEISLGLGRGETFTAIARQLARATSTVSREVKANGGREDYRAWRGHDAAYESARRPKTTKLAACPRLAAQAEEWLEQWWSPQEIARRLPIEFPEDPMMRVSHETIYQSSSSRAGGSSPGSCPGACAAAGPSAAPGTGSRPEGASATW